MDSVKSITKRLGSVRCSAFVSDVNGCYKKEFAR